MRLGSQREKTLQIPIQKGLISFWRFPINFAFFSYIYTYEYVKTKKRENGQFQDRGTNEEYLLYLNLQ